MSKIISILKFIIAFLWNIVRLLFVLLLFLVPMAIFLIVLCLPKVLWDLKFDNFLNLVEILIWPVTVLIILFFFRKVFTYLFFSINRFNFFGTTGKLKNVNEVIQEEVDKKFLEKETEEIRIRDTEALNKVISGKEEEIRLKESAISKANGEADKNLNFAKEILNEWRKSTENNKKTMLGLDAENKKLKEENQRLKEVLPNFSMGGVPIEDKSVELGTGEKANDLTLGSP